MVESEPCYKQIGKNYYYDMNARPLGAGNFGKVYKGHSLKDNEEKVAIKVISQAILVQYKDYIEIFLREIEVLRKIKGKRLLEFKEVLRSPNNIYIVVAFCNGGSLEAKLDQNGGKLSEAESLKILKQVAEAFNELESLELKNSKGEKLVVMHRDIKPANILFHNGEICLADFGFAKLVDEATKDFKSNNTILGTPIYMPPQILKEEKYSSKCDVWSMGVVFYEMLHGNIPFSAPSDYGRLALMKKSSLDLAEGLRKETKDLITKMLKYEEDERISWKEILTHPALIRKKSTIRIIEVVESS